MQTVFGFYEEQQVTKVRRLLRFYPNGNLAKVGYEHWLEWYSVLNGGGM